MPKSKRDKKVSLTKTDKKGLVLKQRIVEDIRSCVEKFKSIYMFTFKNMTGTEMRSVREVWKPSRFFFGKNRVMALGLGRTKEDEIEDDLHSLSKLLKGHCGLLFTNSTNEEVVDWFESFSVEEYAQTGSKVNETVSLNEGPLTQFSSSLEPYLRQLGMPTKLEKGVVTLVTDFEVCKKGDILTRQQAKMLKLLHYKLGTFKLLLRAKWTKTEGVEMLSGQDEDDDTVEGEDGMETDDE